MSGPVSGPVPEAGPVMRYEVRLAAYWYTSMISPAAWDPWLVLQRIGPVEAYLKEADGKRAAFELRCKTLEIQTLNLGLHPSVRDPSLLKEPDREPSREPKARLPSAESLVRAAKKILTWADKT